MKANEEILAEAMSINCYRDDHIIYSVIVPKFSNISQDGHVYAVTNGIIMMHGTSAISLPPNSMTINTDLFDIVEIAKPDETGLQILCQYLNADK